MSHITVFLLFSIPFALLLGSYASKKYFEGSLKAFKYIYYGFLVFSYFFLVINTTMLNDVFNSSALPLSTFIIPFFLIALGGGVFFGIIFFLRPHEARNFIDKNKILSKVIIFGFVIVNLISFLTNFLNK